jgi:membrane protein
MKTFAPIAFVRDAIHFMTKGMWTIDETHLSKRQKFFVGLSKIVHVTIKKFLDYRIPQQAGTCTYITAIALIPIMMVILSILRAFNVFNDQFFFDVASKMSDGSVLKPLILMMKDIMGRAVNIGGAIGLVAFILLAFSTFGTLEDTFNVIWGTRQKRAFYRQLTDYMFLIIIIPLLLSAGVFLYYKVPLLGLNGFFKALLRVLTIFVAVWGALFMFYKIMPNAKVKAGPVMIGAVIVAFTFAILIWAVQTGLVNLGKANANKFLFQVLGPMVVIPISLIFFNVLWTILLLGGILIFSIQSLKGYTGGDEFYKVSTRMRASVTLACAVKLAKDFYGKKGSLGLVELSTELNVHPNFIHSAMKILIDRKIAEKTDNPIESYAILVDPAVTGISDILAAVLEESRAFFDLKTPRVRTFGMAHIDKIMGLVEKSKANLMLKTLSEKWK